MEKDDLLNKDWVANMIKNSSFEQPSDDFVNHVMDRVRLESEQLPESKSYLLYIKTAVVYILIAGAVLFVFMTSDLPFLNWISGKTSFVQYFVPGLASIFAGLKTMFTSKYISFGLLIAASAAFLFLIDLLFSRRSSAQTHPSA